MGMKKEQIMEHISVDPNVCFGKPCIRGRRIWVSLVLDLLADGMSHETMIAEFEINELDIRACLAYGAEMSRESFVPILLET
ncbi:MAG: DUF433 domain-containing protein [Candidatus Hinthialibacter antarcticus]|nr:DUF433 domain-containing protein [Candidatus Hinthialibacter antarcticus]